MKAYNQDQFVGSIREFVSNNDCGISHSFDKQIQSFIRIDTNDIEITAKKLYEHLIDIAVNPNHIKLNTSEKYRYGSHTTIIVNSRRFSVIISFQNSQDIIDRNDFIEMVLLEKQRSCHDIFEISNVKIMGINKHITIRTNVAERTQLQQKLLIKLLNTNFEYSLRKVSGHTVPVIDIIDGKSKTTIWLKPITSIGASTGIQNESDMVNLLNEFIDNGQHNVIFKSKTNELICNNIASIVLDNASGTAKTGINKRDLIITCADGQIIPISMKMEDTTTSWSGCEGDIDIRKKATNVMVKLNKRLLDVIPIGESLHDYNLTKSIRFDVDETKLRQFVMGDIQHDIESCKGAIVMKTVSNSNPCEIVIRNGISYKVIDCENVFTTFKQVQETKMQPVVIMINNANRNLNDFYLRNRMLLCMPLHCRMNSMLEAELDNMDIFDIFQKKQ